jgi:hypothetical protein
MKSDVLLAILNFKTEICSHALAVDFGTLHSSPAVLALNPPSSARTMTRAQIDLSW